MRDDGAALIDLLWGTVRFFLMFFATAVLSYELVPVLLDPQCPPGVESRCVEAWLNRYQSLVAGLLALLAALIAARFTIRQNHLLREQIRDARYARESAHAAGAIAAANIALEIMEKARFAQGALAAGHEPARPLFGVEWGDSFLQSIAREAPSAVRSHFVILVSSCDTYNRKHLEAPVAIEELEKIVKQALTTLQNGADIAARSSQDWRRMWDV
jgi:hypothetical protein